MYYALRSASVLVVCLGSAVACATDAAPSPGEDASAGGAAIGGDGGASSGGRPGEAGKSNGAAGAGTGGGRSNGGSPGGGGVANASGGANGDGGRTSIGAGGSSSSGGHDESGGASSSGGHAHSAGGGPSAGGRSNGGAAGAAGHDHAGGAGGMAAAGGAGGATCPPRSSYPAGAVGSSTMKIQSTSEVPPSSDIGAFRVTCDYSHMSQDDPIVYPGQPCRAHLHTFFGNTLASSTSTYESLRTTGNSTCRGGTANRTAYWIPTLMNDGVPMVPTSAIFYYKAGYGIPNASPKVQKIPAGLRMISGNPMATAPEPDLHAYWGCLNEYKGHFAEIIDCDVGDSLQATVVFPQCWNGVDLDSADHRSHMAFPQNGACPASHPVILPEISQNVMWERTAGLDIKKLRVSSDHYDASLPGGYSVHGDWFEAWEPNVRDAFVTNCINKTVDCHAHLLGDGRMIY